MQCGQVIAWTSFEAKVCANHSTSAWINKTASNIWSFRAFFGSLYRCLSRGARAVFQVYPESIAQRELILRQALQAGFGGGLVVDYPHRYVLVEAILFWFHIWLRINTLDVLQQPVVLRREKSSWSSHVVLFQLVLTMGIKRVTRMMTMMIAKKKRMEW